jgi:hypothetical protein
MGARRCGHPIDLNDDGAALAENTRVCAYGRAGWDRSDPPLNEPRSANDVIDDPHNLLDQVFQIRWVTSFRSSRAGSPKTR